MLLNNPSNMTCIGTTEGTKETRTRTTNSLAKVAFILNKSLAKITLKYFAYKRDPHKWKISTNLMYKLNFFSCGISKIQYYIAFV